LEKHLLVTVSEQKSAFCGVRFMGKFFDSKHEFRLTLFYTRPRASIVWREEKTFKTQQETKARESKLETTGRKALNDARQELVKSGFQQDKVHTKMVERQQSKAMDIISEGDSGLYDAVVLGRRGLSLLEELIEDSTTREVFSVKSGFPFYICRLPDFDRSNVLLCVDGSEPSRRMADHVGFMLSAENRHTVTLFHVRQGAADNAEMHLSRARDALTDNGVPSGSIFEKVVEGKNPANEILAEANENKYAVVATGSTGTGQGLKARLFMGSVSMKLLHEMTGAVLWAMR
jgi:nucleotide-binding universal stress UspA family protein